MFRNYLKTAFRNLWRNKVLSGINILGLSVGLAACLLILVFVGDELSFDRFHEQGDRIVRVTMEVSSNGEEMRAPVTGTKVAPAFTRDFPEVEKAVRIYNTPKVVQYHDKLFEEQRFLYADSTFFQIFSFALRQGQATDVLAGPDKLVLTASTARKYFGNENPVGKTLKINNTKDYLVTGIVADVPANSQIKFDFVASYASLRVAKEEHWWNANDITYLLLRRPEAITGLQAKIPGYMRAHSAETQLTGQDYLTYNLEPLRDVHLYSDLSGLEPNGDLKYIYIFAIIAGLILVIACTNYINLTTAHAAGRAKEVGIRKVIGALRGQLFRQFIGESFIVTFIALLIGVILVKLLLPVFNGLTGKEVTSNVLQSPFTLVSGVLITLVISVLAGSFPAMALANFKPVSVLKGSFKSSGTGIWLRKGLIVFQFVISTFLIVSALIVQQQLQYIQDKKIGYNNQQVLVLPTDEQIINKFKLLKQAFKSNPAVKNVTLAYETPTNIQGGYSFKKPEDVQSSMVKAIPVEKDFVQTLNIPLVAGRDFNNTDEKLLQPEGESSFSFILNESAVKNLGWTPAEAIGKQLELDSRQGLIKGVAQDFHFAPLHETIAPLVIFLDEVSWGKILVKINGQDVAGTLADLEATWKQLAPHRPFVYKFLDEEYGKLYGAEQRIGKTFAVFAFLAILLACLGLFGLAAFTTTQRAKEIGVRKVLGASVPDILTLISKDFLKLVALANIIAWPLAWYAMHRWLEDFAYRIPINPGIFILAGLAALVVAFATISFQALKVAVTNPVKALKQE